ncbi:MAG: LysR family transcriptional regulator [Armatimonadetes bacterium]|nr:LysR family transcriptional regulator [Armatimonadota bacterium]
MEIPLGPLRVFHLVAASQSVNRAAQRLGVTQPAVTQQIRRLERAVGLRLFRRDGRRIVPTEAGQTLEAFARRIFQLVDAAGDALEGVAGLQTGHLAVGASRTAGAYYVADLLDRFKHRHPGVRVTLSVGNSQFVLARILDFTLHAGVIAGRPEDPRLVARPLIRDRLLAVLPPGHPLARKSALAVGDLRGQPLVLREPGSTTRRLIEQAFQARGLAVAATMELEDNEAIKSAVADGIGVAIMAHAAVAQDLASGRLIGRRLRGAPSLEFALVYHRDRVLSPVLAAFLVLLPRPRRGASMVS